MSSLLVSFSSYHYQWLSPMSLLYHNIFTDIAMIFNYINSSKQKPSVLRFDQICLPGMTEDVRLSVFVHRDDFVDSTGKPSN